jgi:AcrR family transcriptional regulator
VSSPAKSPRRVRSDALASRAALLRAARELAAERGPEALTVVAVAERAGLNRSTAYQHFASRQQLVSAVLESFSEELRTLFATPRELADQIDFFVDLFRDRPDIGRSWLFALLGEPGQGAAGESNTGWLEYLEAMERLARSPTSREGIDAEMLAIIGVSSAVMWSLLARHRPGTEADARRDTARFARELKRLFAFGALRPEAWPELVRELGGEEEVPG